MSEIALVYALFGDRLAAEAAAHAMVEQRLAACTNVLADGQSIYPWAGPDRGSERSARVVQDSARAMRRADGRAGGWACSMICQRS